MGEPYYKTATSIGGNIRVQCSDRLDVANTRAQLQVLDGGWKDWGTGVTSYATTIYINVHDSAPSIDGGCGYFRIKGNHTGRHGNQHTLPVYYSDATTICW